MLVQQPPIMALACLECSITPSDMTGLHRWDIPLQAFGGLLMSKLYDLVVQTAEIAPQYFYFRACWSWYETYAVRKRSLESNPDPASYGNSNVAGPFKNALDSADIVLDMWYA